MPGITLPLASSDIFWPPSMLMRRRTHTNNDAARLTRVNFNLLSTGLTCWRRYGTHISLNLPQDEAYCLIYPQKNLNIKSSKKISGANGSNFKEKLLSTLASF
jgi:hypothetical protein